MNCRKHRRWLVCTALAAVLLTVAYWLSRPQIDPRFVGTWTVQMGETTWPVPIWEIKADGTATVWSPRDQTNRSYDAEPIFWRMHGDRLIFRPVSDSLQTTVFWNYNRVRYWFWHRTIAPHESMLTVVAVSSDELRFDAHTPDGSTYAWILRRSFVPVAADP